MAIGQRFDNLYKCPISKLDENFLRSAVLSPEQLYVSEKFTNTIAIAQFAKFVDLHNGLGLNSDR
ncbi:hypothetical protein TUMEXPCC7403_05130 [Tumidithrix helvetica PCC 7403]|uniref:hypothetical protein n=1 Tax=Tumidithrix helvetica TaxID=3457545 RepID=UPI003C8E904C